jgi:hypothetical protein
MNYWYVNKIFRDCHFVRGVELDVGCSCLRGTDPWWMTSWMPNTNRIRPTVRNLARCTHTRILPDTTFQRTNGKSFLYSGGGLKRYKISQSIEIDSFHYHSTLSGYTHEKVKWSKTVPVAGRGGPAGLWHSGSTSYATAFLPYTNTFLAYRFGSQKMRIINCIWLRASFRTRQRVTSRHVC